MNPQEVTDESLIRKVWLFLIDTLQTVVFAAAIFLVIWVFLFRPFQVSGESMYSTFENREYILTNLISLRFEDPKHGDVVVFRSPTDPDKDFIKRVIAIPGDTISVTDGNVYVNGKKLDESNYLDEGVKTYGGAFLQEGEEEVVPPGHYAVMGDNRNNSSDFREWGFLPRKNIKGLAFFVYLPLNHMRVVEKPFTH